MSSLERSLLSARMSKLPHLPTMSPYADDAEDEEDEEEESLSTLGDLPGSGASISKAPRRTLNKEDLSHLSPTSAAGMFAQAVSVVVDSSGLDFRVYYTPPTETNGTVMVCYHGAGYSGLSFACFAKEVTRLSGGECGVLAFDARGHGKTKPLGSTNEKDMSVDVLAEDLANLLKTLFPNPSEAPSFLFVGHSMGGAVCVRTCATLVSSKYKMTGMSVLDVVEGSALEALPHMMHLLESRPAGFQSQEAAIHWHLSNSTLRNPESARISVPSILIPATSGPLPWVWRTPLRDTAPYWTNWFKGLSGQFLTARTARLLVLAGTDRLDRELMIGQMQGKFQMNVVPDVGHMLHEDNPVALAEIHVEFWRRNEKSLIAGIKKVGEE